jgi:hypothetical protein
LERRPQVPLRLTPELPSASFRAAKTEPLLGKKKSSSTSCECSNQFTGAESINLAERRRQWEALTRFLEDGDLEIDNGATERANRDIAIGRGNWTFFGSDNGGKTAAVPLSFIAMCKRNAVEPFAWFRDVLSRIATHPINRIEELPPHNWKPLAVAAQA